jgi:hypothetical protein
MVMNLGTLQRMNLLSLQDQIVQIVARFGQDRVIDNDLRAEITDKLSAYGTQIQYLRYPIGLY